MKREVNQRLKRKLRGQEMKNRGRRQGGGGGRGDNQVFSRRAGIEKFVMK